MLPCDWRILWHRYRYRRLTTHALSFLHTAIVWLAVTANVHAATVSITGKPTPQSAYAARKLGEALGTSSDGYTVTLKVSPKDLSPEAFAIIPRGKTIAITGGDARGLIYGALALREQLLNGTPIDKVTAGARKTRAAFPRHQVQHALGHLSAELGARPALRDRARSEVLGSLARHDGREPLQRVHAVDDAPVHLHGAAEEFSRSQQVVGRGVRRVAAPVPRDLPHGEGTRARHLRGVLEHLRERGVREGARRREARTSTRTTTCRATPPTSRSAICARASRRCSRSIRTSTASACRMAKAWPA